MKLNAAELAKFLGDRLDKNCYTYQTTIILALKRFIARYPELELDEEWAYPTFAQKQAGKGRPFQADCLIRDRRTGRVVCVIEIKNLYQQSVNLKNYLYDLIRLEGAEFNSPIQRLFILAGLRENEKYFWAAGQYPRQANARILQSVLPTQLGNTRVFSLNNPHPKLKDFPVAFSKTLGISLPVRLKTELVGDYASTNARISIWQVKRTVRREVLPVGE